MFKEFTDEQKESLMALDNEANKINRKNALKFLGNHLSHLNSLFFEILVPFAFAYIIVHFVIKLW